jgi:hypothetical protein
MIHENTLGRIVIDGSAEVYYCINKKGLGSEGKLLTFGLTDNKFGCSILAAR